MSVKAQALVWELDCPKTYGKLSFKPSHKFVLIAYADHADHHGNNIFPAVSTIAKKTGLDPRSVQRLTRDLEDIGLLVEDGQGPRGTNRYKLPYNREGDKLSPLTKKRGDKNKKSLGDIPSGDIPSGDKLTPEFKEPEPLNIDIEDEATRIFDLIKIAIAPTIPRNSFTFLEAATPVSFEDGVLTLAAMDYTSRDWLEGRMSAAINNALQGILRETVEVHFVVAEVVR